WVGAKVRIHAYPDANLAIFHGPLALGALRRRWPAACELRPRRCLARPAGRAPASPRHGRSGPKSRTQTDAAPQRQPASASAAESFAGAALMTRVCPLRPQEPPARAAAPDSAVAGAARVPPMDSVDKPSPSIASRTQDRRVTRFRPAPPKPR